MPNSLNNFIISTNQSVNLRWKRKSKKW